MTEPGLVSLVGAGPGDIGLITIKGLARLKEADVILYDRLANTKLLLHARPGAELIDAGKGRSAHSSTQDEINLLLIEKSRQGKRVCRLKGGDPFVFGRGGEEALALARAGLPWEVVPGITSAISAAAYAGIPVTHRGVSASFTVVTGSEDPQHHETGTDWSNVAKSTGTVIVLMGWEALPKITASLIAHGMPPTTPAAVVQWGTLSRQKTATGTVSDIARIATENGLGSPAALITGDVVTLRQEIAWFDRRPLFGRRVLVTRARSQASRLAEALIELGAECIELPAIKIVPVSDTAPLYDAVKKLTGLVPGAIKPYAWATFTSPNAVRGFRESLRSLGLDTRALGSVRFAAVGPTTAQALLDMGIAADIVPEDYLAEAVVAAFKKSGFTGGNVLHFRSDIGRETLPDGLRELGGTVYEVVAYETRVPENSGDNARAEFARESGGIDVTTFTSSSTVKNLVDMLEGDVSLINDTFTACIGPVTATAARQAGIRVDAVAEEQSTSGLVKAVLLRFSEKASR